VRVVIDFEQPSSEHWVGAVGCSGGEPPVRFHGRLQLLRLVEDLMERTWTQRDDREGNRT
jgi:hypothetical protein